MQNVSPQIQQIYNYLERFMNLLRAESWQIAKTHRLQPIQVQMLGFLNICNRYSNTPAGVTDYFGLTKGTVSQSLNLLEEQRLIEKQVDAKDGRIVHLLMTPLGKAIVDVELPPALLRAALDGLSEQEQTQALHLFHRLLIVLQKAHNSSSFGVCSSCRYHRVEGSGSFRCGLTQEPLASDEIGLICREHQIVEIGD